jgi:uncharacterized membrane protein HdeD (DUF308 family)
VEAIFGLLILAHPIHQLVGLIALVAVYLVVTGLIHLVASLAAQSRRRAWTVATGIIAVLLGITIWIGWPAGKLWVVGLCIAIDFICRGASWSALGFVERTHSGESPA